MTITSQMENRILEILKNGPASREDIAKHIKAELALTSTYLAILHEKQLIEVYHTKAPKWSLKRSEAIHEIERQLLQILERHTVKSFKTLLRLLPASVAHSQVSTNDLRAALDYLQDEGKIGYNNQESGWYLKQ